VDFEWDRNKASSNFKKHGVSFQEAATVFGDSLALTFNDPDHSVGEHRLLTFGVTRTGKYVVVSHTELDRSDMARLFRTKYHATFRHAFS
jgi:uncharacterized DUF497 family protein